MFNWKKKSKQRNHGSNIALERTAKSRGEGAAMNKKDKLSEQQESFRDSKGNKKQKETNREEAPDFGREHYSKYGLS